MTGSSVSAFRVGHWTGAATGVTVVLCPPGTVGAGEVRGGAPATRDCALLEPTRTVEQVDAVVLSGGSAFGLATADGVMTWLAAHDRGVETRGGRVPIVPAAAIYDLVVAGDERPGPDEGRAAVVAAHAAGDFLAEGGSASVMGGTSRVGAGRGATVGTWRGPDHGVPGGLGAATARCGAATIGAVAVVNAVGDVIDDAGRPIAASSAAPDVEPFPETQPLMTGEATTLVVLATDARCTKVECALLAQSGHLGLAHAIRPSHTRFDGDLAIALASGVVDASIDRLRVVASAVVAAAIRSAVGPGADADP